MEYPENDAFAKLAVAQGFCTRAQIERCLQIQSRTSESLSVGLSLRREGFISDEQYSQILDLLRKGRKK